MLMTVNLPTYWAPLVNVVLYTVAAFSLKAALLALYLRIFRPARSARLIIWTSLVVIVSFYSFILIVDMAIWDEQDHQN
jgi:hypothetical protein